MDREKLDRAVDTHIFYNVSEQVQREQKDQTIVYDDIIEAIAKCPVEDDEDEINVYQWWIVTERFAYFAGKANEVVVETPFGTIWGASNLRTSNCPGSQCSGHFQSDGRDLTTQAATDTGGSGDIMTAAVRRCFTPFILIFSLPPFMEPTFQVTEMPATEPGDHFTPLENVARSQGRRPRYRRYL